MDRVIFILAFMSSFYSGLSVLSDENSCEGGAGVITRALDSLCKIAGNNVVAIVYFFIAAFAFYCFIQSLKKN